MNEDVKSENLRIHSRADELITCLEGEIAKRDEEMAACRVAVENCEVFRARIAELEDLVLSLQCKAIESDDLRSELTVIKAQAEAFKSEELRIDTYHAGEHSGFLHTNETAVRITHLPTGAYVESKDERSVHRNKQKCLDMLPAAIEAKAQGVVMPEHETSTPSSKWASAGESDPHGKAYDCERAELSMGEYTDDELANAVFMHDHRSFDIVATMRGEPGSIVLLTAAKDRIRWLSRSLDKALARLNGAPVQQVSVPDGFVLADKKALGTVLQALVNAPHHIRELQVTRTPVELFSDNPINVLIANYEAPAAPAADAWIPVGERLPGDQGHDSEEVLCFLNGHCSLLDNECRQGGGWGVRLGYYDADIGTFRVFGRPESHVTHWMPLPAAPIKIEANRHDQ